MCSHYESIRDANRLLNYFGVEQPLDIRFDVWLTYHSTFIVRPDEIDLGDEAVPEFLALAGQFGLLPHWAKETTYGRRTFNARSETVAEKPSFRDAWRNGKRCIIPADAIYEPDWRSGKAVSTRIIRKDGEPMGIAGLWSTWGKGSQKMDSFTMLTINADDHALMNQFHKPGDEKRMVVILPKAAYKDWLSVPVNEAKEFLRHYPADRLIVF
ncbi:SOS response-associated peptidase [Nitrosomonas halophila]|uniref:Abasic site processing protein n=1 Tax=Nitrosomonas halophila TaxID=44576 RepID=A0A1H3N0Q2_9PROT|nr:SOS response-associated peptidase [Nitrosomonas halophila]SDY81819.1 SOS response associated peptidase (SRAP) [Nitrosomonas halophila]